MDLLAAGPRPTARKYAEETRSAFDALVRDGFTPAEIAQAAEDYIEEYHVTHGTPEGNKYLQFLRSFLVNESGARHYILNSRRSARREAARARQHPDSPGDLIGSARFVRAMSGGRPEWLAQLSDGRTVELTWCTPGVSEEDLRGILAKTLAGG